MASNKKNSDLLEAVLGIINKYDVFFSLLFVIFGVYLIVQGYTPSSGAGTFKGVAYPSSGANFDPIMSAIGAGFFFAGLIVNKGEKK